ncbi:MAG: hypothetical protein ACYTAN_04575 [Planctomycetota bacterium]|jgi:4-amino-4-deoxy-L-arabinose transferase-like glycosyltransferase
MTDERRDEQGVPREQSAQPEAAGGLDLERMSDAVGWGLFFIWVGIAVLAKLPVGVALLGVGVITLGVQGARKYFKLKLEIFWVIVGTVFAVAGLWKLFQEELPLVALALIFTGLGIVISAVKGKKAPKE